MEDDDDSDSEVEFARKRKLNVLEDEDSDETDEDDEDSDSDEEQETEESDDAEDEDNPGDDVNLVDDVNNDQCAICLMEFTDQKVGVPNNCTHVFCLVCLQEWAKNINTCPVDRKVFHTVTVRNANSGVTVEEIKVEDRTQLKEEYEDPTTCEICGIGDREERMLLCDGCDRGFHLECLTPPLDNVPEEEWFCSECFLDTSQQDTVDYSQHAIEFSDDDLSPLPFETQSRSVVGVGLSCDSRASTSQQRRARTVASSRTQQTTRRRRRRRQSSRSAGQRSKRKKTTKKTTKKTKSSNKDASTSKTSGTTRKRKRRRKKVRKSRKKKRKMESDGVSSSQSNSRYMLPHEMEPTATFSLFGSDFDLEYLPVIESPSSVVTQTSSPRSSTASNPDVLSSIFTGLNTLHSNSLSVDNKGRIKHEEDKTTSQLVAKSKVSTAGIQTTSNKDKKPVSSSLSHSSTYSSRAMLEQSLMHAGNVTKQSNDPCTGNCEENESSRLFINEKRIKRFDTSANASTITTQEPEPVPLAENRNLSPKSDQEIMEECKKEKLTPPTFTSSYSSRDVPKSELRANEKLTDANLTSCNSTRDLSKSELIPTEKLTTSTDNLTTITSTSSTGNLSKSKFRVKDKLTTSTLTSSKLESGLKAAAQSSLGSYKIPRKKPSTAAGANDKSTKSSNLKSNAKSTRSKNVRFNIPSTPKQSTGILHLLPPKMGMSSLKQVGGDKQTNKQLLNKTTSSSKSATYVPDTKAKLSRDSIHNSSSERSTTFIDPARPVAVVRPTKVAVNNSRGISHDAEAAKKRREGIERLQRKQAISEEVKKALKPYYRYKEISKENYKDIYGRAMEKIMNSSLPVVSHAVAYLVKSYVKKLKGRQMQSNTIQGSTATN